MTERTIAFLPESKVNTFLVVTGKSGKDKDRQRERKENQDRHKEL